MLKESGRYCIPVMVLKNCEPELFYVLAELFNKCLKEPCFPDCWKVLLVVPVFKNVGERSTAENYHPVSLLLVDVYLNWLNWFHFLSLKGCLLVILINCMTSVTIPRCYKDVYIDSLLPYTARLQSSLPIKCFPLTYVLNGFKSIINRHQLTAGSLERDFLDTLIFLCFFFL